MSAGKSNSPDDASDREIVTTRVFNAPRELVWKVRTEPEHIAQWWGPDGFTNTIHQMDVSVGGVWEFIMHGPNGVDYKNKSVYSEVVKPSLLVYRHVSGPAFTATVTFEELDGTTEVSMRMVFDSAQLRNQVVEEYGAIEGAKQTFNRLSEYLSQM